MPHRPSDGLSQMPHLAQKVVAEVQHFEGGELVEGKALDGGYAVVVQIKHP